MTPAPVVELDPEIPPNFTTYTSEGLFSISYPPDLVPDIEFIDELSENAKETMKTTDPEVTLEGTRYVFLGHIPIEGGSYGYVLISVGPMPAGRTLDEWVEEECQYERNNQPGFLVYSQAKTVFDGSAATILEYRTWGLDTGEERNVDLFTVKDGLLWEVGCSAKPEYFRDYEDTFYSILSSFRILTNWRSRWTM